MPVVLLQMGRQSSPAARRVRCISCGWREFDVRIVILHCETIRSWQTTERGFANIDDLKGAIRASLRSVVNLHSRVISFLSPKLNYLPEAVSNEGIPS